MQSCKVWSCAAPEMSIEREIDNQKQSSPQKTTPDKLAWGAHLLFRPKKAVVNNRMAEALLAFMPG